MRLRRNAIYAVKIRLIGCLSVITSFFFNGLFSFEPVGVLQGDRRNRVDHFL